MWGEITTWLTPGQFTLRHIHIYIRDNSTVFLLFFFLSTVLTSKQPAIPSYQNITFDDSILTLCNSNITFDNSFVTFGFFFSLHLTVLFSHCAVLASYVTVLSHIWWFPYFFSYCPVLISHLTYFCPWFWNPDQTVRSDRKTLETLIFAVLLEQLCGKEAWFKNRIGPD